MFDFTSRYATIATGSYTSADGRSVTYVLRRWLPSGALLPVLAEVIVQPRERLDLLTHRTLGDPLQFWRVADANDATNPFELEEDGRILRIPVPQP